MKHFNTLAICLLLGIIGFTSCRESDRDEDSSTIAVEGYALSETLHHDLFKIIDEAVKNEPGIKNLSCATITADTVSNPKTMIIDFGSTNCAGADGVNRRGVINVTVFSGYYSDSGAVVSITPASDYFVNDYKVTGTVTLTNRGINASGNTWYFMDVNNLRIANSEWNIVSNADLSVEWTAGTSTPMDVSDDSWTVTGSFSGVDRVGVVYTGNVATGMTWNSTCSYINAGIVNVTPGNLSQRSLDFGTACSSAYMVTIGERIFDLEVQF